MIERRCPRCRTQTLYVDQDEQTGLCCVRCLHCARQFGNAYTQGVFERLRRSGQLFRLIPELVTS